MKRKSKNIGKVINGYEILDSYQSKNSTIYVLKCCNCGKIQKRRISNFFYKNTFCECKKRTKEEIKLHYVYYAMISRCYNKNNKSYKNYGNRGIEVCCEWKENFYNFYNWSIKNGYIEGLTLDRINNNGNYEPDNCRWVNRHIQNENKRGTHKIIYNNNIYSLKSFCKLLDLNYQRVCRYSKKIDIHTLKELQNIDFLFIKSDLDKI